MDKTWRAWAQVVLLAAIPCPTAAAQEHPISLRWDAPSGCPSRNAVLGEIDRLLGGHPSADSRKRLSAWARVTRGRGGEWELALRTEIEGAEGERRLHDTTCQALADAAALIIALGFDPAAVAAQTEREAAPASPSPAPASSPQAPPPQPLPAQPPPAETPPVRAPPQRPSSDVAPLPRSPAQDWRGAPVRFGGGLGLGGDVGSFGQPALALSGWASLFYQRLRADLSFVYFPPVDISLPERPTAGGRFTLLAGALSVCRTLLSWHAPGPDGERHLALAGCGGLELGRMSATGYGVNTPGEGGTLWLAPRAGIDLAFAVAPPLALRLGVAAEAPIPRGRFVLERLGPVHMPSAVVGRVGLGAELDF
jgi:hypothetical protein